MSSGARRPVGAEERRTLRRLSVVGLPIVLVWGWSLFPLARVAGPERTGAVGPESATLRSVMQRIVDYPDPQVLRVYADERDIGSCRIQFVPPARERAGDAYEMRCNARLRLEQFSRSPLHVIATTGFDRTHAVSRFNLRAFAGGLQLRAAADAGSEEIEWTLEYGGMFRVTQRTPIDTLNGLALAGPLALPGVGDLQLTDPGVLDRFAASTPTTTIRLEPTDVPGADVCFVVETSIGDGESVVTRVLPDGRIAAVESSVGITMAPSLPAATPPGAPRDAPH